MDVIGTITARNDVIAVIRPDRVIPGTTINGHIAIRMGFAGQVDNVIARTRIDIFDINNRRIGSSTTGMITVENDGIVTVARDQRVIAFTADKAVI